MSRTLFTIGSVLFMAAASAAGPVNDTATLLTEIIRINTGNPPGNEAQLGALLKSKFAPLGFQIDIIPTPDPAKAHFIARLKGDGTQEADTARRSRRCGGC